MAAGAAIASAVFADYVAIAAASLTPLHRDLSAHWVHVFRQRIHRIVGALVVLVADLVDAPVSSDDGGSTGLWALVPADGVGQHLDALRVVLNVKPEDFTVTRVVRV